MVFFLVILVTLLPFLPLLPSAHWSVRVFDFIRLQILAIQFLIALVFLYAWESSMVNLFLLIVLASSILYQIIRIYPYTVLHKKVNPKGKYDDRKLKLVVANVLQTNTSYSLLINEIKRLDPDIFITMESNIAWEEALSSSLQNYVYSTKVPLNNFYGMHLFSKIPLKSSKVEFLVEKDIPSIHSTIQFNKQEIRIIAIHPAPPSPTENETSKERDAELMIVAQMYRANDMSTLVCGDLNDVVWSKTSRLFTKVTGFLDPRIGKGLYPTFHAKYWLLRFPLDHLFYSKDLNVPFLQRLKPFGSDHFGMYYEICTPLRAKAINKPSISSPDCKQINNIIQEGTNNKE